MTILSKLLTRPFETLCLSPSFHSSDSLKSANSFRRLKLIKELYFSWHDLFFSRLTDAGGWKSNLVLMKVESESIENERGNHRKWNFRRGDEQETKRWGSLNEGAFTWWKWMRKREKKKFQKRIAKNREDEGSLSSSHNICVNFFRPFHAFIQVEDEILKILTKVGVRSRGRDQKKKMENNRLKTC